jgi:hypothetical protein
MKHPFKYEEKRVSGGTPPAQVRNPVTPAFFGGLFFAPF